MYKRFSFSMRGEVTFGAGCMKELPAKVSARHLKRVLLMADPALEQQRKNVERMLSGNGIDFTVFIDIEADPSTRTVAKAVKCFTENQCEGIVALGGGSAMDAAKAAALVAINGGKIEDYERPNNQCQVAPIFAIPTTAGTGSEVSRVAVITDNNKFKMVIGGNNLVPEYALLDPEAITTLPASITASSGMDALIHAVEAYLSLTGNVFTDCMAEKALQLIGRSLRAFVANRRNLEAAEDMLLGSMFAGVAQSLARPGNTHALSHALSGLFHIPHGVANAVLFPHVLEFNALSDTGKYKKIYSLIKPGAASGNRFEPEMLIDEARKLNKELGIPNNLSELGVTKDDIPRLLADTLRSTLFEINPRQTTPQDVEQLYLRAL
ncbi:MAG: iron-containing alcohol dehydrogenase [Peptococcaceae bacterium]|jgi:alcohol dehydrogenase|nr:iron-containing alcohol dehydrogenase [Peptococcaceae bacterium]MDH7525775.1 iron-containing alcohol dehydrogenase [Peptococcaceae bacterium]